jgi:photosystem II stability/assembly factor-like uncharacterized protein
MSTPASPLRWRPTNAPVASVRTDDLCFVTPDLAWAVNSNGQIIHTSDGGDQWTVQFQASQSSPEYLRAVTFANPDIGWVGSFMPVQTLYHTTDGGNKWAQVKNLPGDAPKRFCGLYAVNERVVYAAGTSLQSDGPPRMMKTTDGGQNWKAWDMGHHAATLIDVYFATPDRGWVVGGRAAVPRVLPFHRGFPNKYDFANLKPVVLYTEDGGASWVDLLAGQADKLPLGEWGWKIQFVNDHLGYVSLEDYGFGGILKTTDGGQTWQRLFVVETKNGVFSRDNVEIQSVGFVDEHHGWVGGEGTPDDEGGYSSETTDGGQTWSNADAIGSFLNRFQFFGHPVTLGYSAGKTVYKYSAEPVPAKLAVSPLQFLKSNDTAKVGRPVPIRFTVPAGAQRVTLDVFNRFGLHAARPLDEAPAASGSRVFHWDTLDPSGNPAPPGHYLYRLVVDGVPESGRVVISP